jgi:hypothetical protein
MCSVYFKFALEPIWIASFSFPHLNGIWILLRFTAWCSLFDDQGCAIILWVLYIASTGLNLVTYRFYLLVLILRLVSRSSRTGHALFYCGVLSCIVSHIYTFKPCDVCMGVYWCCIMMSNILFRLLLSFVCFCSSINLLSLLK